jgi:hypothetical protein
METTKTTTFTKINEAIKKNFSSKIKTLKIYFIYILSYQSKWLRITELIATLQKNLVYHKGGINDLKNEQKYWFF